MLVREVLRFVHGPHREPNASARHPIPAAKCALIRPAHDDVIQESRSAIFSQWKERHRAESCPPVIKITISFFTYSCEKWQEALREASSPRIIRINSGCRLSFAWNTVCSSRG